jgi:hypothetical protein
VSNFSYTDRWPAIGQGLDPATVTSLETHDRELEQYLYAPPRVWAPTIWSRAKTTPVEATSGFAVGPGRWERLRGRFCVASVVAVRTTGSFTGSVGIALPDVASPAPVLPGITKAPAGGFAAVLPSGSTAVAPGGPTHLAVPIGVLDQRALTGQWIVVFNMDFASLSGGGDVFTATFLWRTT